MNNLIREIQIKDKLQWQDLYKDYAKFYKVEMNDQILKTVWDWLHDKNHEVNGIVYETEGDIVALAHFRSMPRPLKGKHIGFLDDFQLSALCAHVFCGGIGEGFHQFA